MLVENISVGEKKKRKERQYRSSQEFSYVLLFSYIWAKPVFIASYFHMKFMHSL